MNKSLVTKLRKLAIKSAKKAYSPYSKAKVGCALITSQGNFFTGCNIENSSYGATVCAERIAIFKALSESKAKIETIYIYTEAGWPPCGICRQVMSEFASKKLIVIIGSKDKKDKIFSLGEILPHAFTPGHLI